MSGRLEERTADGTSRDIPGMPNNREATDRKSNTDSTSPRSTKLWS